MKKFSILLAVSLLLFSVTSALADPIDPTIYFTMKHSLNIPKSYTLRFSLWTHPTSSDEFSHMAWSEEDRLRLTSKKIKHYLGEWSSLSGVDFSEQYWIQVDRKKGDGTYKRVGSRVKFVIVPYAFHSESVGMLSISTDELEDGAVTADKLGITCDQDEVLVFQGSEWACQSLSSLVSVCTEGDFVNCYTGPAGTLGVGECKSGIRTCDDQGDYGTCDDETTPSTEICDDEDNDCDGGTDEDGVCCGNGSPDPGEECDDGNLDNTDSCLDNCVEAACGDSYLWMGEEDCDDGNLDNTDACLETCVSATCGDGYVQASVEECDDGNDSNLDTCLNTCVTATCGDGYCGSGEDSGSCPSDCASGLFFSEYVEGSSSNEAYEIYNATGASQNLASCQVKLYADGSASPATTLTLSGSLSAGDVYVVCYSSAEPGLTPFCDLLTGSSTGFNGDDALELVCGNITLDVIGQIGFDPGNFWGGGFVTTQDDTLRRKCIVTTGDSNGSDAFDPSVEWDGFAQDNFDDLGVHCPVLTCGQGPPPPLRTCDSACNGGCQDMTCVVDCTVTDSCKDSTISCPVGFDCMVQCGAGGCDGATINCPDDYSCEVSCSGAEGCASAAINCSTDGVCLLSCDSSTNVCDGTTLSCGSDSCISSCSGSSLPIVECGGSCDCGGSCF